MIQIIGKTATGFILQADRKDIFLLTGEDEGDISLDVGSRVPVGRIVKRSEGKEIDDMLRVIRILREKA